MAHIPTGNSNSNSTQTRTSRRKVMLEECLTSNAQVSNRNSSRLFHNRYLLESILKSQVQKKRMSCGPNFQKQTKEESFFLCLLPAVRAWARQNTQNIVHAHARFGSIYSVFAIRVRKLSKRAQRRLNKLCGCVSLSACVGHS